MHGQDLNKDGQVMTHSVRFADDDESDLFDIGSLLNILFINFQLPSLRALRLAGKPAAQDKLPRKRKRGNPYSGAASGLPRRLAPRKNATNSGSLARAWPIIRDAGRAFGIRTE